MVHYTYVHILWVYVCTDTDTLTCACNLKLRFSSNGLFQHIHFKLIRLCEVFFLLLFILKTLEDLKHLFLDSFVNSKILNSNFRSHYVESREKALGP